MAREDLHFRLRIPEELKKRIEAYAGLNNRSMTAEIISRLEDSINEERRERIDAALLEQMRLDLAFQQGMNASLQANLDVFIKHLASPEGDAKVLLDRIIADIKELKPPKPKGSK